MKTKIQFIFALCFIIFFGVLVWRLYDFAFKQRNNEAISLVQNQVLATAESVGLNLKLKTQDLLQVSSVAESTATEFLPPQTQFDYVISYVINDKQIQVRWQKLKETSQQMISSSLIERIKLELVSKNSKDLNLRVISPNEDQNYYLISTPLQIRSKEKNEIAFVAGVFQVSPFQSITNRLKGVGIDVFIVNQDGQALGHLVDEYVGKSLKVEPIVNEVVKSFNNSGNGVYYDVQKNKSFGSFEKIEGSNIFIAAMLKQEKVVKGQFILIAQIFVLGFGLLVAGLILINVFSSDALTEMERLKNQVKSFLIKEKERERQQSNQIAVKPSVKGIMNLETQDDRVQTYQKMAATFSDVIRAPMTSILGHAQIAKNKSQNAELKQHFEIIENEARSARELLEKLNVFSGTQKNELKKQSVNKIIQSILDVYEKNFEEKSIQLRNKFGLDKEIKLNAQQLQSAIKSVIDNAIEAMDKSPKKEITINTETVANDFIITIEDTGEGLDKDIQEKAFDPFFTTRKQKNKLGLGLSSALGAIKEHGGNIKISSEPGKGTQVKLILPLENIPKVDLLPSPSANQAPLAFQEMVSNKKVPLDLLNELPPAPTQLGVEDKTMVVQSSQVDLPPIDFTIKENLFVNKKIKVRKPGEKQQVDNSRI